MGTLQVRHYSSIQCKCILHDIVNVLFVEKLWDSLLQPAMTGLTPLRKLRVSKRQGPETEVGGSVGNHTKNELNGLNSLVDEDLSKSVLFFSVVERANGSLAARGPAPSGGRARAPSGVRAMWVGRGGRRVIKRTTNPAPRPYSHHSTLPHYGGPTNSNSNIDTPNFK